MPQGSCFRQSPEDSARWEGAEPVRRAQSGRSLGWPGLSWGSLALGNRHHGVGLQDRPVHPQQRPGQPGGRVPAHAGLGGRLPAPGCNGRVTPRGSGRAGRAGRVAAPQRAPVGCTASPVRRAASPSALLRAPSRPWLTSGPSPRSFPATPSPVVIGLRSHLQCSGLYPRELVEKLRPNGTGTTCPNSDKLVLDQAGRQTHQR